MAEKEYIEWEFNCSEFRVDEKSRQMSKAEDILESIVVKARELKEITGREPTIFMSVDIASTIVAGLFSDEDYSLTGIGSLTRIGQYEVKITRGTNELYVGYEILEKKGE